MHAHAHAHARTHPHREKIAATEDELAKEASCVSHLLGRMGGSCELRGAEDTTVPGEN